MSISTGRIELPQDITANLFVLAMAMHYSLLKNNTKTIYELEVANQEVQSLSNLPRDVARARVRDLAARKRHYGSIESIPNESILKKPPNWMIVAAILLVGASLVVYGQYNPQFAAGWNVWFAANSGYLIVGTILFMAVLLLYFGVFRRKRKVG